MSSKFAIKSSRFLFSFPLSLSLFCFVYFFQLCLFRLFTCLMRFIPSLDTARPTPPPTNLICLPFNAFNGIFAPVFPLPAGLSIFPPKFICWFGIIRDDCVASVASGNRKKKGSRETKIAHTQRWPSRHFSSPNPHRPAPPLMSVRH